MKNRMRWIGLALILAISVLPAAAEELDAKSAFESLAALEGTWNGVPEGDGEAEEAEATASGDVVHEFRLSAAGTVVMETMGPGTPHEMINMYHLDGEELVLTHYCAGGNQPTMRLDRKASSAGRLVFDFTGGTNLDPAVDQHIHSAEIVLGGPERITSIWEAFADGEKAGEMTFHLARVEGGRRR